MSATRNEINQLLGSLTEKDLRKVRSFVKVLLRPAEKISEEELQEVRKGEEEFRRGDWVRWEDVRTRSV